MKKALALFLVLFIAFSCFGIYAYSSVGGEKENVTYTVTTVEGDEKYAHGIRVTRDINWQSKLWWNTSHTIDEESKNEAKMKFYPFSKNSESPDIADISLDTFQYYGFSYIHFDRVGMDYTEGARKYADDFTKIYEKVEETGEPVDFKFRLADYFDYYPVGLNIGHETMSLHYEPEREYKGIEIIKTFRDFFKIPVLEDDINSGTVEGNRYSSSIATDTEKTDNFFFDTHSVAFDDGFYFTFNNKSYKGKKVDVSLIPGGYGIYCLPVGKDEKGQENYLHQELSMVYSLDEDTEMISMVADAKNEKIYMLTLEETGRYFTVIDKETMTDLERIKLYDSRIDVNSAWFADYTDEYVVIMSSVDDEYKNRIQVFEIDGEGKHTEKLNIITEYSLMKDCGYDWNGERLAVAAAYPGYDPEKYGYSQMYECGFRLFVFDASGILYEGNYFSSLDTGADELGRSSYFCNYYWQDEPVVEFLGE